MISRFHQTVPTKEETAAFNRELRTLKPLDQSPVRLVTVEDSGLFGDPVDLGIFPRPSVLTAPQQEA
ncbi:MAG: hypothetical protein LKJ69_04460 [Lactobacillus sp.]|jgi:hypothetical protein|nr:hypothetical protein [Lactobacillus sp.]MCI2032635.1 hypothetical protein [Lactobacillus sp.]